MATPYASRAPGGNVTSIGDKNAATSQPEPEAGAGPVLQPYDLFPMRIWQARPAVLRGNLDAWAAEVSRMRAASPQAAGHKSCGGWNSVDMTVLERPVFAPLRETVRAGCAHPHQPAQSRGGRGPVRLAELLL